MSSFNLMYTLYIFNTKLNIVPLSTDGREVVGGNLQRLVGGLGIRQGHGLVGMLSVIL